MLHIQSQTNPFPEYEEILDANGNYVIPGLVDVHIHGAKGHDFCDANTDGLSDIAAYLYSCGVTSFCATSMTLPENQLMEIFETVSGVPDDGNHAYVAGIHMEGPFLSPAKKGARKKVTSATLVQTYFAAYQNLTVAK